MSLLLLAARWTHFAAIFALFGAPLFLLYGLPGGAAEDRAIARRWVRRAIRAAMPIAVAAALAWAGATLVDVTDDPASLLDGQQISGILAGTGFGRTWLVRFALLAALVAACWRAGKNAGTGGVIVLLAGLLLVSQAWLGHAAGGSGPGRLLLPLAYALHLLGAAAWIGGLLPLAGLLAAWRASGPKAARRAGPVLRRFSRMGIGAVALVGVGGAASATFHLATPAELVSTLYGQIILAKAALFAVLLTLAARNRSLSARLVRAPDPGDDLARVLANSRAELSLALLVLALASLLGVTPPGP